MKESRIIEVLQVDAQKIGSNCEQRSLMESEWLRTSRVLLGQGSSFGCGHVKQDCFYFVVEGDVLVSYNGDRQLLPMGSLLYCPPSSEQKIVLTASHSESVVLVVETAASPIEDVVSIWGTWVNSDMLIILPDEPIAYKPAKHESTSNTCLFANSRIEFVRGKIDSGGGSDLHKHDGIDQLTYVISPDPELLVITPSGVLHGGERYEVPLDLLVIYSPPYGEALEYMI